MSNYKKDTLQKEFALSDIDHIEEASEGGTSRGEHKLEVTIHFRQTHPYYLRALSLDQYHTRACSRVGRCCRRRTYMMLIRDYSLIRAVPDE